MIDVSITGSHQEALTNVPVKGELFSALDKYARSQNLSLILPDRLKTLLDLPLKKAAATPVSQGIELGKAFEFGAGQPQFSVSAGKSAAVHANAKKDAPLVADDPYGAQISVKDGEGYLSLMVAGTVAGNESQSAGDITPGFGAGESSTFEFFRRFPVDDAAPTLGLALGEVISAFVMPADTADLHALRAGDVATCSGKRQVKFSGEFSACVSAVPLASPALPLAAEPIRLNAGARIDVKASYEIASDWQIRARAIGAGIVELGVYRRKGSEWDFSIAPSAGIGVCLGSKDLLTALIGGLSKKPEAEKEELDAAGLHPDEIKAINAAISSAIDHGIRASLCLDLDLGGGQEAAFLYRVELDKLNSETAAAVSSALKGDLTAMDRVNPKAQENGAVGPGVTLVRSILTRTRETGTTFKVNFIGLFNFLSLQDFLSKSQVIHEPASGDVVFKETASGERIGVIALPQNQTKLRKAIFDSILMTTVYRGGGALENMGMECAGVHFAMNSMTNEHTMSDYLDWFVALGALTQAGKGALMENFHGTGASTCTLRVAFGDDACNKMFFDSAGQPRQTGDYIQLGRRALQQLLLPGDEADADGFRRDVLGDDALWDQFHGQTTIGPAMEKERGWQLDDPRLRSLIADYSAIVWWAGAMSSTGNKIAEMRDLLKTAEPTTLETNAAFLAKKADVQNHVMKMVKNCPMSFDQPFGLVALARAGAPAAIPSGILLSPALNREFTTAAAGALGQGA